MCSFLASYFVRTRNVNFPNTTTLSIEFLIPQSIINNPRELGDYGVDIFYPIGDKQTIKKSFQGQSILVVNIDRLQIGKHMINSFVKSPSDATTHELENRTVTRSKLLEKIIP